MSKELVDKELSKELDVNLKFEDGKLKLALEFDSKSLDSKLEVALEAEYFIDKLAEAIPGQTDDKLLELLKVAFKI